MEPPRKRRFTTDSKSCDASRTQNQWRHLGDGFDGALLPLRYRKPTVVNSGTQPQARKGLFGKFEPGPLLKSAARAPSLRHHDIDLYSSSDEESADDTRNNKNAAVETQDAPSQISSTLPSIEDVESSQDVAFDRGGAVFVQQQTQDAHHMTPSLEILSVEISDFEEEHEEEHDVSPPSPVFGMDSSQVRISDESPAGSTSGSSGGGGALRSEREDYTGGRRKTSEWVQQLQWRRAATVEELAEGGGEVTPRKIRAPGVGVDGNSRPVLREESSKKKNKLIKDGFAARLQKVISRDKSSVRFRSHRMQGERTRNAEDKSGILSVTVIGSQEKFGHMICTCHVLPLSQHLLRDTTSTTPETTPGGSGEIQPAVVLFHVTKARELGITHGCTVHVSPPWQKLNVPDHTRPPGGSTGYYSVIMCTQVCDVTPPIKPPDHVKIKPSEARVARWRCPCVQQGSLSDDCPCELNPFLPSSLLNGVTSSPAANPDAVPVSAQPGGLSIVGFSGEKTGVPLGSSQQQYMSILDSIERGGPTVNFTATVQRVTCQRMGNKPRWSLLLQDVEGTVCEVVLPPGSETESEKWTTLEGHEVVATGLRIIQRINSSSAPELFSLIESLWTEQQTRKFIPRKIYSQDSQELLASSLPPTTTSAQMPGFCYSLSLAAEEGLIQALTSGTQRSPSTTLSNLSQRPNIVHCPGVEGETVCVEQSKSAERSHGVSMYCEPVVTRLRDALFSPEAPPSVTPALPLAAPPALLLSTRPRRVTICAQLIYVTHKEGSQQQRVCYIRDASISNNDVSYASVHVTGSHFKMADLTSGHVFYFRDLLVESGHFVADGVTTVAPWDALPARARDALGTPPGEEEVTRMSNTPLPVVCAHSVRDDLVSVTGYVSGVDEDTACSWPVCPKCQSDINLKLFCVTCQTRVRDPLTRMHLEVFLTDTGWGSGVVKVKLLQETIEKLLPDTVDDEGYELMSVLNKRVGPINCLVLRTAAPDKQRQKDAGTTSTLILEEIELGTR